MGDYLRDAYRAPRPPRRTRLAAFLVNLAARPVNRAIERWAARLNFDTEQD